MQKYVNAMMNYCKIDYPLDFKEICLVLFEKAREKQIQYASPLLVKFFN